MKTEYISWKEFDKACHQIADKVKDMEFEDIYGIPRGGLMVAIRLSHLLGKPIACEPGCSLVVDDIADSGKTLEPYKSYLTATIHYKPCSSFKPDVFVKQTDKWVVYPWETRLSDRVDYVDRMMKGAEK